MEKLEGALAQLWCGTVDPQFAVEEVKKELRATSGEEAASSLSLAFDEVRCGVSRFASLRSCQSRKAHPPRRDRVCSPSQTPVTTRRRAARRWTWSLRR